mgnify:CR=1 FL=1
MITSETSPARRAPGRARALIATLPSSWAGRLASEPLNAPTGVLVALAMTMVDWSVLIICSKREGCGTGGLRWWASCCNTKAIWGLGLAATIAGLTSHLQHGEPAVPAQAAQRDTSGSKRAGLRCTVVVAYALQNGQPVKPYKRSPCSTNPDPPSDKKEPVVIKKYANRRLYNTETSTYVTLDDLAAMVKSERDFVVFDAKTGDDLTHSVLTQIIVEQESRMGSQTLLPIPFLRQLIRFYGDSIETPGAQLFADQPRHADQGAGAVSQDLCRRLHSGRSL